jgi:hypothetical protein
MTRGCLASPGDPVCAQIHACQNIATTQVLVRNPIIMTKSETTTAETLIQYNVITLVLYCACSVLGRRLSQRTRHTAIKKKKKKCDRSGNI